MFVSSHTSYMPILKPDVCMNRSVVLCSENIRSSTCYSREYDESMLRALF